MENTCKMTIEPVVKRGQLGGWMSMLLIKKINVKTAIVKANRAEFINRIDAIQNASKVAENEKNYPTIIPIRFFIGA
jgi:hypothetical protein